MNLFVGMGRLIKDPEVRYSQSGKPVTSFTIAIDRPMAKGAENKETDFIGCVAFGKTAETIGNYVSKGQRILVEGNLRTGSYTDKQGNKRYTTDIWISNFEFVEKRGNNHSDVIVDAGGADFQGAFGGELKF